MHLIVASQKLHESLGFQHEGVRRECIYSGGKYCDEVLYGMTFDEFAGLIENKK
jgi:RimJ/RimL family protein N-acetyltransferase